jgi:hypothetical protein
VISRNRNRRAIVIMMRVPIVVAILVELLARARPARADIIPHAGLNLRADNGAHPLRVIAGMPGWLVASCPPPASFAATYLELYPRASKA